MAEEQIDGTERVEFNGDQGNSTDEELEMFGSDDVAGTSYEQPFYFESDHAALKGNKDYHLLLKTVFILEAQRARAVSDLGTLLTRQAEALADPLSFVQMLQKGDLNLPRPQQIAELPAIEWENYAIRFDTGKDIGDHLHMTRFKKERDYTDEDSKVDTSALSSMASLGLVVRGRVKNSEKPETFNQLWTAEEQLRLEELLVKFPPEEVESRRYDKIAQALGNRTRQQVASRVQKYFIKLARAGLPVPGRLPSSNLCRQKLAKKRHRRPAGQKFRPFSTFMVKYEPPVYMPDDDDASSMDSYSLTQSGGAGGGSGALSMSFSELNGRAAATSGFGLYSDQEFSSKTLSNSYANDSDEDIPESLKNTDEYRELMRLKFVRASLAPGLHPSASGSMSQSYVSSDSDSDTTN